MIPNTMKTKDLEEARVSIPAAVYDLGDDVRPFPFSSSRASTARFSQIQRQSTRRGSRRLHW